MFISNFKTNIVREIIPTKTKLDIKKFLFENTFKSQANYIKEIETKSLGQ